MNYGLYLSAAGVLSKGRADRTAALAAAAADALGDAGV